MLRTISLSDCELNVFDAGTGDVLLFVHGFPLDHRMWQAQLDEFSKTHRVIAPDLRGFGQSEDTAGTITMEHYADDLAAILKALDITAPVTLCGLSMGGYIAWQFWRRHSHHLKKLILCDTRAVADSEEARQTRLSNAERVLNRGPEFLADSMLEKLFAPGTREQQPRLVTAAKRVIKQTSPLGISGALLGMAERVDVTGWLPTIRVPTLVIVGQEDVISPVAEMKAIADAIPGAILTVIPGAGHMSPQEQPQLVNQAIRSFLDA